MSTIEKLRLALDVLEECELSSVLAVNICTETPLSIQINDLSELESLAVETKSTTFESYEYGCRKKFVVLVGVKIFVVINDKSKWLGE